MKYIKYSCIVALCLITLGCKTTKDSAISEADRWYNIAVVKDIENFVDTTSITRKGALVYALEKRVYLTPASKKLYVDRIRQKYEQMGMPKKADKWNDFSYSIYYCEYECTNKRFRALFIEDFDTLGKRIVKTRPSTKAIRWLNVDAETVGEYTFFYICDYK